MDGHTLDSPLSALKPLFSCPHPLLYCSSSLLLDRGQRSVRLNKAYRVIYIETVEGFEILIIEMNKHEH